MNQAIAHHPVELNTNTILQKEIAKYSSHDVVAGIKEKEHEIEN